MPTASSDDALPSICILALHHRWVFLHPPQSHFCLSSPPDLLVFGAAPGYKSRQWGPSMIRLPVRGERERRKEGTTSRRRGEGGPGNLVRSRQVTDAVSFSPARTCTGGTFSWVLHKGAMDLLGPNAASRIHKASRNYFATEIYGIYRMNAALLILAHNVSATPECPPFINPTIVRV